VAPEACTEARWPHGSVPRIDAVATRKYKTAAARQALQTLPREPCTHEYTFTAYENNTIIYSIIYFSASPMYPLSHFHNWLQYLRARYFSNLYAVKSRTPLPLT
jgi:hypothetical protein